MLSQNGFQKFSTKFDGGEIGLSQWISAEKGEILHLHLKDRLPIRRKCSSTTEKVALEKLSHDVFF